jgi:hypothetical protein
MVSIFKKVVIPFALAVLFVTLVVLSMLQSAYYSDRAVAWIYRTFIENPPPTSTGLAVSIVTTFIGLIYVLVTQNRTRRGLVRRYRWGELWLMDLERKRMLQGAPSPDGGFRREMLTYHSSYRWYSYADFGFLSVVLIVVLFAPDRFKTMQVAEQVAVFLALALLGVSTIILGFTDMVHTNTLSPLVTSKRRMTLVAIFVMLGGVSFLLQVCAVSLFLALINPWLSLFSSVTAVAIMILMTEMRGVPILELKEERDLSETEMRELMDA